MVVKIPRPAVGGKSYGIPIQRQVRQAEWQVPNYDTNSKIECPNTLLAICNPALSFISQLTLMVDTSRVDSAAVRQQVVTLLEATSQQLRLTIADPEIIQMTSVLLCVFIDEVMMATFKETLSWNHQGLFAVDYHGVINGGEVIYTNLDHALQQPDRFVDLLGLYYYCFSFGLKGKELYTETSPLIEQQKTRIYALLIRLKPEVINQEKALGIYKDYELIVQRKIKKPIYIFGLFVLLSLVLIGGQQVLSFKLKANTAQLTQQTQLVLNQLQPEKTMTVIDPAYDLKQLLQTEIDLGVVDIQSEPASIAIVLPSASVFSSGSVSINSNTLPVLHKIAKALEHTKGMIIVEGHTDNRPVVSQEYQTNWALSLARANEVVKQLDAFASLEKRLVPEGKGDTMPLVPNDSAENRAKNRRVVIKLTRHQ